VHQKENERPVIIKRAIGIGHNREGNALFGIPGSALDGASCRIPRNQMYDPPVIAGQFDGALNGPFRSSRLQILGRFHQVDDSFADPGVVNDGICTSQRAQGSRCEITLITVIGFD